MEILFKRENMMLPNYKIILFGFLMMTLLQSIDSKPVKNGLEIDIERVLSHLMKEIEDHGSANNLLNGLKNSDDDSNQFIIKSDIVKNFPTMFKKSWNLPVKSLKWYAQNSAGKSNEPQEMYDQLVGAFHK